MTEISPFRGVLYHPEHPGDIARLVAPPYDMISPEEQQALCDRDDHNIVRLILGCQFPEDTPARNRYTRAAEALKAWLGKGILRRDEAPALYVYDQEYSLPRKPRLSRHGFIALARLEELGKGSIHPHEKTMSGPKEDRLNLMLACRANFSQVFSFYDDPAGEVERVIAGAMPERPLFDFTDRSGVRHALTPLTDKEALARVRTIMADRALFIADGHHRYETALNFRRIMRERLGEAFPASYDHVMMYFANMSSPGLTILPFHRLVSLPEGVETAAVITRLADLGNLAPLPASAERYATINFLLEQMSQAGEDEHRFGVWAPPAFYLLSVPRGAGRVEAPASRVDDLDVSVLHRIVLEEALGAALPQAEVSYLTREEDILARMDARDRQVVFFLNPTRVDQVRDIAATGLRMPPKSTNFHPKLISGLVLNLLEEDPSGT